MKILVIQMARLGDLFQTLPTLAALRRQFPRAEIHVAARKKFSSALDVSSLADRVWQFDSRAVLTPVVSDHPSVAESLTLLESWTSELASVGFDKIINLSFSPFSSYLTHVLTGPTTEVCGYTRFADGYLSIPDDASAYFYAQMGAGPGHLQFSENANRVHLTDLFAQVAGVELIEEDWLRVLPQHTANTNAAVVIHIGASTLQKTLSWHKWMRVIIGLLEQTQVSIVVVGSKDEREFANQAVRVSDEHAARITNRVGETSILELVEIIREAQLLIAGDSAPAQLASLTNTPVLNLSFPIVSAYETAPRSARTRILRVTSDVDLAAEEVVREAVAMLNESTSTNTECERTLVSLGRTAPFSGSTATTDFEWALLQAVYMGQPFPPPSSTLFSHAIQRLHEVNEVAIEQLPAFSKPITQAVAGTANGESQNNASQNNALNALSVAKSILDRVDDIMNQVVRMVPETGVFVRWFQTERLRVGPRSLDELIAVHFQLHDRLREILSVYLETENREAQERVHEDVVV